MPNGLNVQQYTARAGGESPVDLVSKPLGMKLGDSTPNYWFDGNPFLTHYMNAFSGILPEGERFMIASVRSGREKVRERHALQRQISGFIGQEAYHAQEHTAVNRLMQSRGLPFDRLEAFAAFTTRLLLRLPEADQMALTGAAEHLTALFGKLILSNPEVIEQVHPTLRPIMIWHAIEELEHKSVAFDLFEALGGGYLRRIEGLLLITLVISGWILYGQLLFMWGDRSIFNLRATARGLWWMFGFGASAGYFRRMLPDYLHFLRPGFHPAQDDCNGLIKRWRPELDRLMLEPSR